MIDRIFALLALALAFTGLLLAWSQNPLVWYGFSAVTLTLLAAWCVCRLLLPSGLFSGGLPGAGSWQILCIALIPAWGLLQLNAGWTVYRLATEVEVLRWAVFVALFFLAARLPGDRFSLELFRVSFGIYAFALTTVSLLDYMTGMKLFGLGSGRSAGPFLNVDHFATFILLGFPVALYEAVRGEIGRRLVFAVAAATMIAAILGTMSRAGVAIFVLEVIIMALLLKMTEDTSRNELFESPPWRVPALIAGLGLVFSIVVGWTAFTARLQHITADGLVRYQLSEASLSMFLANPWKGYGLGTWADVYPAHALFDRGIFANAAHDDWLQWACDGGVPVLGALLLLFSGSVRTARRHPWTLGLPIVMLHCVVDFPLQGKFLAGLFWAVYGVASKSKTASE